MDRGTNRGGLRRGCGARAPGHTDAASAATPPRRGGAHAGTAPERQRSRAGREEEEARRAERRHLAGGGEEHRARADGRAASPDWTGTMECQCLTHGREWGTCGRPRSRSR